MILRRKILVTGGSSGIGLSLVSRLCQRHEILVTARKPGEHLTALMDIFDHVHFLALDQSEPASIQPALEARLADLNWQALDNVILNAGTGFVGDPAAESASAIRTTLDVNLTANLAIARTVFPYLKRDNLPRSGGKLTVIGSTARKGSANFASYAASKAALHGFGRAIKEEWRGQVKVQVLHPGPTKTDMHAKAGLEIGMARNFFADPDAMAKMIESQIVGRRFSINLGLLQYWGGAQYSRRTLR